MPIEKNIKLLSWLNSTSLAFGAGSVAMNSLAFAGGIVFGIASIILGALADRFDARTALIVTNVVLLIPLFFYRKIFLHEQTEASSAVF